jgi:hypothetical protein
MGVFKEPPNKAKLTALINETDAEGQAGGRMLKLMPVVTEMLTPVLNEFGYTADEAMMVMMQIQTFAPNDPTIGADIAKLFKAVQGDLSDFI